jgi:hypothetical protein
MNRDPRGRETKTLREPTLLRYHMPFSTTRDGTKWILRQTTFVPLDREDYSKPVFLIVKWLIHEQIQRNCNAAFLFVLDITFAVHRRASLVSTFETFTGSVLGYLHLVLGLRRTDDFLETFVSEGREHSILSGWFITPWAGPSWLKTKSTDSSWIRHGISWAST